MIPLRQAAIGKATKVIRSLIANPVKSTGLSKPEEYLDFQLRAVNAPLYERQFRITPERLYRADFYFPVGRLVVEVQGGGYIQGRHSRGKGMEHDAEKSALIAQMPARLIYVTPKEVKNGTAIDWILKALST